MSKDIRIFIGIGIVVVFFNYLIQILHKKIRKYEKDIEIWKLWAMNEMRGAGCGRFFESNGLRKVAIYGCNDFGETLYFDLLKYGIEVAFFIDDKKKGQLFWHHMLKIIGAEDIEDGVGVDAIVITDISEGGKKIGSLKNNDACRIISIEDVVRYMR